MNEKMTCLQIKKMVNLVIGIVLILVIIAGCLMYSLSQTMNASARKQMTVETEEYKNRINKQIEADFQSLDTLASFFTSEIIEDRDFFSQRLDTSNKQNYFRTMAFFYKNGSGIVSTLGLGVRKNMSYKDLNEAVHPVIEKAFEGEKSVSRLFESDAVDGRVFAYAIPVYIDGELKGVLMATDEIEIFSDIINGNTVLGGNGYLHMVGTEGNFLVRSPDAVVKEKESNIFDGPYFDPDEVDVLKQKMKDQQKVFSSFIYEGEKYQILLDPVGLNGWYLLCVNTLQDSNRSIYPVLGIMGAAFIGVALIILFLLIYGFRLVQRNNRELWHQAYHDSLTGAKNLPYFNQELVKLLSEGRKLTVAALNIQQFKFINEIFGREYGDTLLKEVKEVLDQKMRDGEFFARDKADLFYLCLLDIDREQILTRLQDIMNAVINISSRHHNNYQIRLYCGVAANEENNKDVTPLMIHAMFALTTAKRSYQNNVWFYDSNLHEKEKKENYVESHMHQALRDGEFKFYLQPKVDLVTGQLKGAEALVRWVKADGSMIYPDEFIPLFEQNGFCTKLDLYMVECACRQIREWMDEGIEPVGISVNQSKLLFYENDYITTMTNLIQKYNIQGNLITLEILEGLAADHVDELNHKISLLQEQGFRISMDDFGSGYSSLNILGNLHIDELKLDRGFLMEVSDGKHARARIIMEQIVQLTRRLRIATVVEGVETAENEKLCSDMGCDLGQGYYYSRPIPREEFNNKYMKKVSN